MCGPSNVSCNCGPKPLQAGKPGLCECFETAAVKVPISVGAGSQNLPTGHATTGASLVTSAAGGVFHEAETATRKKWSRAPKELAISAVRGCPKDMTSDIVLIKSHTT